MKRLTCEMCGSNDLVKQDGFFVCESCGCKYSVEEAKKLMVEVEGTVEVQGTVNVQNAAQLSSLLNLAYSSFESKNYAQAEAFCNQVIAIDSQNYEAWKLKGEAINYQITSKNPRILEVYNCIMTSYDVLDDEGKAAHRSDILKTLTECLEGEIKFWLQQFEAGRPTDGALNKVKLTFLDCRKKMSDAFAKLGLSEVTKDYLTAFDNYFIVLSCSTCESAWKSTVGYNYYRDDFNNLGASWGEPNMWTGFVSTNTKSYRPLDKTWKTFTNECGNLIELLVFATKHFNGKTSLRIQREIYERIIFYHERLAESKSYEISSNSSQVGWIISLRFSEDAIAARKKIIASYKEELQEIKKEEEADKIKNAKAAGSGKSVRELLDKGYAHLRKNEQVEAATTFDMIIETAPDERVGYLGKAIAMGLKQGVTYDELFATIPKASQSKVSPEYRGDAQKLIDYPMRDAKWTLLLYACNAANVRIVEDLIAMGANVNYKSQNDHTPLYIVSAFKLKEGKVANSREIARILLEHQADPRFTDGQGLAVYNKDTDPEIGRMIKSFHPGLKKAKKPGGCYVATCVYGSYDCPEVWTLRRYRDNTLASTWYGRAFIHTYYAVSPTLVRWFGDTDWFKQMWRGTLDHMVNGLREKGVEDTPYEDRDW